MAMSVEEAVERRHGPECPCTKCVGFEAGNQLARRHGGYSLLGLGERAAEIAEEVRPTLPAYAVSDEPVLQLFAVTCARIERANAALEHVDAMSGSDVSPYVVDDAANLQRLREDMRAWIGLARRLANDLGLAPLARSKLGVNVAATRRLLGGELVERYGGRPA